MGELPNWSEDSALEIPGCVLCWRDMEQPVSVSDGNQANREPHPGLDVAPDREAEENLERYLALVRRIYDRIRADPDAYAHFRTLTGSAYSPTIEVERSDPAS